MGGWAIPRKWRMWCCSYVRRLRGGLLGSRLISVGDLWFRGGARVRAVVGGFLEYLARSFAPSWTGEAPVATWVSAWIARRLSPHELLRVVEVSSVLLPSLRRCLRRDRGRRCRVSRRGGSFHRSG